jgi:hypothetical protein
VHDGIEQIVKYRESSTSCICCGRVTVQWEDKKAVDVVRRTATGTVREGKEYGNKYSNIMYKFTTLRRETKTRSDLKKENQPQASQNRSWVRGKFKGVLSVYKERGRKKRIEGIGEQNRAKD